MINSLTKALSKISVGPSPSYGFGPGSKAGVSHEGGPGSGRRKGGGKSDSKGKKKNPEGVMGHTTSGKPIYSTGNKGQKGFSPQDHKDAYIAHSTARNNISSKLDSKRDALVALGRSKGLDEETVWGRANSAVRQGNPEDSQQVDHHNDMMAYHRDRMGGSQKQSSKKDDTHEADSATTAVAQLRDKKESVRVPRVKAFQPQCSFKEATSPSFKSHKFEVEIIKEGLGNFRDCFFYTKESLQRAAEAKLFEGAQSFADHPSESEENDRPERSTKDILGYYENVQFKENEVGQGVLVGNLVVNDAISIEWATVLMANSVEYSKKFKEKDLVGLSINANGSAQPMSIEDLIKSQTLADPVLAKLNEAMAQGITEVNVVNELKEAQSVDLVTKAGAGGRILQMLEQEKKKMKQKHETMETEDGQASAADGATPDHADAAQDEKLFAQMIKKYLGKDAGELSAEEAEAAKCAVEAHKEAGMESNEAYEAAGKHMQMAMEVGKKMAQKQTESHEGEAHEAEADDEKKEGQKSPDHLKSEGKKESMKVAALSGEVAKLRESVRKYELRDYLDKKLSESGKSNIVTKKFRETLGLPKSKEQIDATWKIFISAYEAGAEEVGSSDDGFFGEKQTYRESSGSKKSFSDCLR